MGAKRKEPKGKGGPGGDRKRKKGNKVRSTSHASPNSRLRPLFSLVKLTPINRSYPTGPCVHPPARGPSQRQRYERHGSL